MGGLDYFWLFWPTVNFEECKVVLGFEVEFKTHICLKRDASAAQLMQRLVGYANWIKEKAWKTHWAWYKKSPRYDNFEFLSFINVIHSSEIRDFVCCLMNWICQHKLKQNLRGFFSKNMANLGHFIKHDNLLPSEEWSISLLWSKQYFYSYFKLCASIHYLLARSIFL